MEEIAIELLETIRWIPENERKSKWYLEYLDACNTDLKQLLIPNGRRKNISGTKKQLL